MLTIVAADARRSIEHADAFAQETGSQADEVRRGAIPHLTDDTALCVQLIDKIKDAGWRGDALAHMVSQSAATWGQSEALMTETLALARDTSLNTKLSILGAAAAHLQDKSQQLKSLALSTACLAEWAVFLGTMEAFATVVARDCGAERLFALSREVRQLFATLGCIQRWSSLVP